MEAKSEFQTIISESGYQHIAGADMITAADPGPDFTGFARQWDDLPADPYLTEAKPFRFRRHGRVLFDADDDKITVLPHTGYLQAAENNSLFGGVSRRFAPMSWTPQASGLISRLVRASVAKILKLPSLTLVNLHQIRIVGGPQHAGTPVPEGRHRDGFDFISINLISRDVDGGGETRIYDADGRAVTITLSEPMDAVYVDDRLFSHDTTPIIGVNRQVRRDVLLMSFERSDGQPS